MDGSERPRLNLIDLYAGVGGLTQGFTDAGGFDGAEVIPRLLVDSDKDAQAVGRQNFPGVPYFVADLRNVSGPELRSKAGLTPDDRLHVLVGGPPCQGFSWLGKRALEDERNTGVLDFLRLVKELRPLVAVIENVPLVITSHDGQIIQEICDAFAAMGYASCADVLIASEYGVPQLRKRAFVVAYSAQVGLPPQLPPRTHERVPFASDLLSDRRERYEPGKQPYVSVEDAIGDLPPIRAGGGDEVIFYSNAAATPYQEWARRDSVAIFNHRSRSHSDDFLKKISVIQEGGRNQDLPPDQRFSENYFSQAYARLHRNGLAQTLTTCFGNPGSGRFMHYRDLRAITVREAARLQSFPDRFVFSGHHNTQMRHLGNSVPPLMARAVRDQIARDLLAARMHVARTVGRPRKPVQETPGELRSRIMRAVPAKNTSAELLLRDALSKAGVRGYRLHAKDVPGNADVVFRKYRVAVFVDGCFWHGCASCYRAPKTHRRYWEMKVARNRERDKRVSAACGEAGWTVVRVWGHEIAKRPQAAIRRVQKALAKAQKESRFAALSGPRTVRKRKVS